MAGKRGSSGSKAVNALIGAAAAFGARKVLFFLWKTITGKEPPEHPEDPQVALREALIWGIVLGAGVHTARMLATRATTSRRKPEGDQVGPPA
jgi:methylglyoxal synthase